MLSFSSILSVYFPMNKILLRRSTEYDNLSFENSFKIVFGIKVTFWLRVHWKVYKPAVVTNKNFHLQFSSPNRQFSWQLNQKLQFPKQNKIICELTSRITFIMALIPVIFFSLIMNVFIMFFVLTLRCVLLFMIITQIVI